MAQAMATGCLHRKDTQRFTRLKARAQKIISIISHDKAKIRAYCEVTDLGGQLVEAAEKKDEKKVNALMDRSADICDSMKRARHPDKKRQHRLQDSHR